MNDSEVLILGYTVTERVGDCRNMEFPNNKDPPYIKMTHRDRRWEENEAGLRVESEGTLGRHCRQVTRAILSEKGTPG